LIILPISCTNKNKKYEMVGEVVIPPSKKLEDLIRLAELCVDLLRQNEEFYAEV
jgi:hypothetical protein